MSVESRAPVVSRTAPTTPGVMNATAQQDIDSTQTDVAVMMWTSVWLQTVVVITHARTAPVPSNVSAAEVSVWTRTDSPASH